MSEAEIVSELVGFTDLLLSGLGVFFTIVSAYIAALNYFVRGANLAGRIAAYLFVTFVLMTLIAVLHGARQTHSGLIARLAELEVASELSVAGQALLANARGLIPAFQDSAGGGIVLTVDQIVVSALFAGVAITWIALFFLTFVFRWGEGEAVNAKARGA